MEQIITNNPTILQDTEYVKISTSTKGVITWDFKMLTLDIEKIKKKQDELETAFPRGLCVPSKSED